MYIWLSGFTQYSYAITMVTMITRDKCTLSFAGLIHYMCYIYLVLIVLGTFEPQDHSLTSHYSLTFTWYKHDTCDKPRIQGISSIKVILVKNLESWQNKLSMENTMVPKPLLCFSSFLDIKIFLQVAPWTYFSLHARHPVAPDQASSIQSSTGRWHWSCGQLREETCWSQTVKKTDKINKWRNLNNSLIIVTKQVKPATIAINEA